MSTSARPFETAFVSENYERGSVTEMLKTTWASTELHSPKTITTQYDQYHKLKHSLEQVVDRTYLHELGMFLGLRHVKDWEPIADNAWWVYDGYKYSFEPLFDLVESDRENRNEYVQRFQQEVMEDILEVLAKEALLVPKKEAYYGMPKTINLDVLDDD